MKVLVTGANGFLGHWLVKTLSQQGHEVDALVRPKSDLSELDGIQCHHVHGDVTNLESLRRTFSGVDTVFHLAGVIAYKPSDLPQMEKVNVQGTAKVIEAAKFAKIKKLVHLSSVVAIGAGFTSNDILNEESTFNVGHLKLGYFDTKLAAEKLVLEAYGRGEIDAVILNPSTIYGAGDAKKGSRKTQVKVAQGKFPFYTSGGVNVVAVEDVVQGIISAWKKGRSGERYILASENLTIKELFEEIAAAGGVQPPKIKMPNWALHGLGRIGDIGQNFGLSTPISSVNAWTSTLFHWFDSSKARKELDFNPGPSKEAIKKSVHWMKDNGYLSKD